MKNNLYITYYVLYTKYIEIIITKNKVNFTAYNIIIYICIHKKQKYKACL